MTPFELPMTWQALALTAVVSFGFWIIRYWRRMDAESWIDLYRQNRRLKEKSDEMRLAREWAFDDLNKMHAVAAGLRKQLAARACPRCRSLRLARFCGNCGADQLPPGTPLVQNEDGTFRPAKEGEKPLILMGTAESREACGIVVR